MTAAAPSRPNIPEDLNALTKSELLDLGSSLGIDGLSSRMLKAEIIHAIEEATA